ncbi:hypothetical protein EDB19DRAFT_1827104 [Suillus lakei]|nr:hypothetical protein EDB19DRAFT_1827104 [Suillus lakei]
MKVEWEHHTALKELQESVASSELGRTSLAIWEKEITTSENDHTQQNLFKSQCNEMTQAVVRLELAWQDTKDIEDGLSASLHVEVTLSILISTGINLEHVQHHLHANITSLGQHSTDNQHQLIQFKGQHIYSQGATTQACQTIQTVENHLILSHAKYTHAYWALMALSHQVSYPGWDINFKLLKKAHL